MCPGNAKVLVFIVVFPFLFFPLLSSLSVLCRFYRVCIGTLVVLLSPGFLAVALNVLNLVVFGVFGDEVLESLGHLVLQSICLTISDLQRDEKERDRLRKIVRYDKRCKMW